ncbi:hypothetical protein [Streptomyces sp. NPDC001893]|uniref:P-type ATPase n=1 Tax=Streptomyces sp. NPDC001893 TaxID=3154530 RepID=UPI00331A3ABB
MARRQNTLATGTRTQQGSGELAGCRTEGDIVVADAELAEVSALLVDESMLTGESVPVDEAPGARLSAWTVVVSGRGVATVTATGADSVLGRIAAQLSSSGRQSAMNQENSRSEP